MGRNGKRGWILGAALMLSLCLCGCGKRQDSGEDKPRGRTVTLKALTIGKEPEAGMDALYEQLDALTKEELGCVVRFTFIPWGDERNQINIAVASGEYDFIPNGNFSDYKALVSKNAFLDLNLYLELVPELVRHYDYYKKGALKETEINGGLYGIPQYGAPSVVGGIAEGFLYREDLRREWGLEEIRDLDTMEAYLYRAKEEPCYAGQPMITDNRIWVCLWHMLSKGRYLELGGLSETPFVVLNLQAPYEPVNRMATEEFGEVLAYLEKWSGDGLLASDLYVSSDNEGNRGLEMLLEDRKPCETNIPFWVCNSQAVPALYDRHPDWEFGFFSYATNIEQNVVVSNIGGASVLSVSGKSAYPEQAVRFLEKVHTDERYYNLVKYGVEGIHYHLENGCYSQDGISGKNVYAGWTAVSDERMALPDAETANASWRKAARAYDELVERQMKQAEESPLQDFRLDLAELAEYKGKLDNVLKQYYEPMMCGSFTDRERDMEEAAGQLEQAGMEEYLALIREQLAAYKEEKGGR